MKEELIQEIETKIKEVVVLLKKLKKIEKDELNFDEINDILDTIGKEDDGGLLDQIKSISDNY